MTTMGLLRTKLYNKTQFNPEKLPTTNSINCHCRAKTSSCHNGTCSGLLCYHTLADSKEKEMYGCTSETLQVCMGKFLSPNHTSTSHSNRLHRTQCCNIAYCNNRWIYRGNMNRKFQINRFESDGQFVWYYYVVALFIFLSGFVAFFVYHYKYVKKANNVVYTGLNTTPKQNNYTTHSSVVVFKSRTSADDIIVDASSKRLGSGSFGTVYLAEFKGQKVAVKIFEPYAEKWFQIEKKIIEVARLQRNYFLTYYFADDKIINGVRKHIVVTDYCELGSLKDKLMNETVFFTVRKSLMMYQDLCRAVDYLHRPLKIADPNSPLNKPAIAHRDLKSNNVFVRKIDQNDPSDDNYQLVLGDLGLAVIDDLKNSTVQFNDCISTRYKSFLAPELLSNNFNTKSFEAYRQADIYSLSLIMWEIRLRTVINNEVNKFYHPYEEYGVKGHLRLNVLRAIVGGLRPTFPSHCGDKIVASMEKLIGDCWSPHPEARPTALKCVERVGQLLDCEIRSNRQYDDLV